MSYTRRLACTVVVSLLMVVGVASLSSAATSALHNPAANIAATPDIFSSGTCTGSAGSYTCTNPCVSSRLTWPLHDNGQTCTLYVLAAINHARGTLHEPALVLPTNWYTLSVAQQLFVMADMERVGDGYPAYLGLNVHLSAATQKAAAHGSDPSVAAGFSVGDNADGGAAMGGSWSEGLNVLEADYVWMYDDGWGGSTAATSNIVCTSATSLGCWAHRDELLGSDPKFNLGVGLHCRTCEMGAAYSTHGGVSNYVDLIEFPKGKPPAMTFTWAHERRYFRGGVPYTTGPTTTTTLVPVSTTTTTTLAPGPTTTT